MTRKRKNYTVQEKVSILRKHLLEGMSVSDVCEEHGLNPTVFYRWQKMLFENAEAAFEPPKGKKQQRHEERKQAAIERKLQKRDEVLAELMAEHIALKKSLGEL